MSISALFGKIFNSGKCGKLERFNIILYDKKEDFGVLERNGRQEGMIYFTIVPFSDVLSVQEVDE